MQTSRTFTPRLRILPPRSLWPHFLQGAYDLKGTVDIPEKGRADKRGGFWGLVHDLATKNKNSGGVAITNEDDLNCRALATFPVWLKARLAEAIVATLFELAGGDSAELRRAFIEKEPVNTELAKRLWEKLVEKDPADALAMRLRPPGWSPVPAVKGQKRFYPLQWIEPVNPVDLAALLTEVRRYPLAHEILENLPAHYRQSHPSFRGRICPVQSPESELVGLSLHLARGAEVDWDGRITPADGRHPCEELGFGASLVPFYEHNDGARCMMGAKNLRQAVPLAKRQAPLVKTGGELVVQEFVKPLVDAGICPDGSDGEGALALGVDLLVAYLPWKGMNVDDAIVVGEHVVEGGRLDFEISKRFRGPLKSGWVHTGFGPASVFRRVNERWEIEGITLHGGDLIATVGLEGCEDRVKRKLIYRDRSPAKLTSIGFHRGAEWMRGELEYELVKYLKLGLGDKLMGRHGNKGVVGAILPSDQMPGLPNDERLPAHLRGKPIDILLNPHGVISRMNVGQLLETHIGWLLHTGYKQEQFLKHGIPADASLGRAFLGSLDHVKVQHLLEESGLDRFGRIPLILPDGSQTASPVVVGFQHIVRLKHVPELKAQARRGGEGAAYSRSTGQAIHGRLLGGGQRAGEMEVWALAGHRAEHILEELLGVKADSVLTHRLENTRLKDSKDAFEGFSQRLKDWLFALLIDLHVEDNKAGFTFLDAASARNRIGADKKVSNSESIRRMVLASFSCQSKKKGGCSFQLLEGQRIAAEPPKGKSRTKQVSLKLEELLDHLGLGLAGPLKQKRGKYFLELRSVRDGELSGQLKVSFDSSKTQVKATIHADDSQPPPAWPNSLNGLPLCGQFSLGKGRNAEAALVLEEFLKEEGRWRFGELAVACPKEHSTTPLKGKPPFDERLDVDPGSLFDENLFGSISSAGTADDAKHWAFIELPLAIPYPVESFLCPEEDVGHFMRKHSIQSESLPSINVVPVLPLRYRMPLLLADSTQQDQLVTEGYIPIINACLQYETAEDDQKRAGAVAQLRRSVMVLFRLLVSHLTGKEGLIRHDGLGRRVDRSARLVIVPNPHLRWDEAGVPTAVLLELLGEELKRWIKEKRQSGDLAEIISVMTLNREDADVLADWSWRKSTKDQSLLEEGHKLLCRFLDAHPDVLVILNRQPSLHRDSIQAFRPVPMPPQVNEVLQLSPLVCKGFGADFDGDEMAIHVPISQAACEEAKRMLPSQNMFSLATGKVLASYEQDFVLGMYWLSREKAGFKQKLIETLPGECCRRRAGKNELNDKEGAELLKHLALAHPEQAPELIWKLSQLAYDCCSRMGVSFGFYELAELSKACAPKTEEALRTLDEGNPDKINDILQQIVKGPLEELLKDGDDFFGRPGLHFAAMALSGARGEQQVRQLVAARGFLAPGSTALQYSGNQFLVGSSLVHGMSAEEAFFASMNARSSMCDKKLGTRNAGYLTRRLVTALWPTRVVEEDCGDSAEAQNPATCRTRNGICAACYGAFSNGDLPPIGFPAGLIAAQSIGERGTQLSMQSFHTGEKAFTIQTVLNILDGREKERFFEHPKDAVQFVTAMMKSKEGKKKKPYRDLEERHFLLVWRVIHDSPEKTLRSATQTVGLLTRIAFEQQGKNILLAACGSERASMDEPFARVLFNQFGTRYHHMEATPA